MHRRDDSERESDDGFPVRVPVPVPSQRTEETGPEQRSP